MSLCEGDPVKYKAILEGSVDLYLVKLENYVEIHKEPGTKPIGKK